MPMWKKSWNEITSEDRNKKSISFFLTSFFSIESGKRRVRLNSVKNVIFLKEICSVPFSGCLPTTEKVAQLLSDRSQSPNLHKNYFKQKLFGAKFSAKLKWFAFLRWQQQQLQLNAATRKWSIIFLKIWDLFLLSTAAK